MLKSIPSSQRTFFVASLVDSVLAQLRYRYPDAEFPETLRVEWTIFFLTHGVRTAAQTRNGMNALALANPETFPGIDVFTQWCLSPPVAPPCIETPAERMKRTQSIIADHKSREKKPFPLQDVVEKLRVQKGGDG